MELARIAREYDQSTPWTENDVNEKRTTPTEFKKPDPPTHDKLLTGQIAYQEKRKEAQTQRNPEQHSTPMVTYPLPIFENKFSPIDKKPPTTRLKTQTLVPIKENVSFDDEPASQVKRQKIEHSTEEEELCFNNIDEIDEDVLTF